MTPSSFFHSSVPLAEGGNNPHDKGAEPFSTSKTSNWVARAGGLPTYIQHVAHAFTEKGTPESEAIKKAVGIVRNWSEGKQGVGDAVKAAAAKAMAEWDAKRAKSKASPLKESLDLLREHAIIFGGAHLTTILSEGTPGEGEALLREAAKVVEGAPRWMLPIAAKQPGFQPTKPETTSSSSSSSTAKNNNPQFNAKHPRQGGKFISKGTTGTEVGAIQARLGVTRTGTYTAQTKARVETFQKNHGLQVDGVVGAQTVAAMRGNTGVAPGALSKNDRRFLRRYGRRH